MTGDHQGRRSSIRSPIATPEQVAAEPASFPAQTASLPVETFFADWRERLMRNLSRRSTSRWEPLTWVHSAEHPQAEPGPVMQPRRCHEYCGTLLWSAIDATITELLATRELSMNTAPEYVIGYLCDELVAKRLITPAGFEK